MNANNNAKMRIRDESRYMWLIRRSLDKIGCGGKETCPPADLRKKQPIAFFVPLNCYTEVYKRKTMRARSIFGRRTLALLGCAALLFFAAGGSALHHHSAGPDTVCHICQALHMPALATAPLSLIPETRQAVWHVAPAADASPSDSFARHCASRAPPAA